MKVHELYNYLIEHEISKHKPNFTLSIRNGHIILKVEIMIPIKRITFNWNGSFRMDEYSKKEFELFVDRFLREAMVRFENN